jgi:hypothetical protein
MDYRVASNIRGKSLSSLITDRITSGGSVGSSIKSAISDKLKAKGTGIKEKFDPMNIARAMTGGGKLAPAILGKITGRSQSDINYFAGNKKSSTYTKMPFMGQVPSEGFGGSAIEVLNKMLSFMQKNREVDLKRKQTSMSFEEEKQSEEQRRHNEFLKVLKDYTSLGGGTTMVKKEEDGGFLDTIKSMLKTAIDSVKNMIENFKILLAPLLEFAKDVGISGLKILGKLIGLLAHPKSKLFSVLSKLSGLLSLATFSNDLNANNDADLAEKQKMAPTVTPGVRKQFSRNEIDLFVKENKFFDDDKLKDRKAGFPGADRPTLQKWLDDNPNPNSLYIPDKEKDIQRPVDTPSVRIQTDKEKQLYQNEKKDAGSTPTATPVSPRTNPSSGRNQDSQSGVTGMPYSTPVPSTPTSSAVVGKIQENNNLNLRTPVSFGGSSSPSVSVNNSSTSAPDQTVTATATTRDDTAILAFVLNRTKSQV